MCPEFASGHMEKDWHTTDRRQRNYQTSTARSNNRCSSYKNHEGIAQRDKWDNTSRRNEHLDHESHCSLRNQRNSMDDTDRRSRTERNRSSLSECRHKEEHVHGNRRSRSRSPGYQRVVHRSDSSRQQEERNDSSIRRHSDSFSSRSHIGQDRSPRRDRSCRNRVSIRSTEQDRYIVTGARHPGNELESQKCQQMSNSNNEKAHCSKYRHPAEHIVSDNSSPRREEYSKSNRGNRAELYENIQHCRHLSSVYNDCKHNYQSCSSFYDCECCDSGDHRQQNRNTVSEGRLGDGHVRRNTASPVYSSRNELNSALYRDRSHEDGKKHTTHRRRSSPCVGCTSIDDSSISVRKQRTNSNGHQSASRSSYHRSESRSADKANISSLFEQSSSKTQKLSKHVQYDERELSYVSVEKSSADAVEHISDHVSSKCGDYKDRLSICQPSQVTTSCSQASGKTDTVSSGSQYCVAASWPSTHGGVLLGSEAQPMIHSGQLMVASGDPVAGSHLLRPRWPGSAITVQHAATASTRLHDLVPTAAVTRLPLLSTRTSAVPMNIDPSNLSISGVSLNSNINLCTAFNPAVMQRAGGSGVVQYVMDDVYGDSPLLDEPSYSPVAAPNSTFSLVGSSISSVDYMRPELMQSMDSVELQKMLDVVTVAKTTLEQTLPPACQADPNSQKQKKVVCEYFTLLFSVYYAVGWGDSSGIRPENLHQLSKSFSFGKSDFLTPIHWKMAIEISVVAVPKFSYTVGFGLSTDFMIKTAILDLVLVVPKLQTSPVVFFSSKQESVL